MAIREVLLPLLVERFADRGIVAGEGDVIAVIPAAAPEVGDITVWDDGDEVMLGVGELTHTHFYEPGLPPDERLQEVVTQALDFLDDLLNDRVWLSVSEGGASLFYPGPSELVPTDVCEEDRLYTWSGPKPNPRAAAG